MPAQPYLIIAGKKYVHMHTYLDSDKAYLVAKNMRSSGEKARVIPGRSELGVKVYRVYSASKYTNKYY